MSHHETVAQSAWMMRGVYRVVRLGGGPRVIESFSRKLSALMAGEE